MYWYSDRSTVIDVLVCAYCFYRYIDIDKLIERHKKTKRQTRGRTDRTDRNSGRYVQWQTEGKSPRQKYVLSNRKKERRVEDEQTDGKTDERPENCQRQTKERAERQKGRHTGGWWEDARPEQMHGERPELISTCSACLITDGPIRPQRAKKWWIVGCTHRELEAFLLGESVHKSWCSKKAEKGNTCILYLFTAYPGEKLDWFSLLLCIKDCEVMLSCWAILTQNLLYTTISQIWCNRDKMWMINCAQLG